MRLTLFLSLALFFHAVGARAAVDEARIAEVLRSVDAVVANSSEFIVKKEGEITLMRTALDKSQSGMARYELAYGLYEEYRPFLKDSALVYLDVCIEAARKYGDYDKMALCMAKKAHICSNAGMYVESLGLLAQIDTAMISGGARIQYYVSMAHVCGEVAYYSPLADYNGKYGILARQYRQRVLAEADPRSADYLVVKEQTLQDAGDTIASMAVNDYWLDRVEHGSHGYALVSLYRYLEYKLRGDTTNMFVWLGEAVIADIRNGVMDQGAMWELANQLMLRHDIDRAYRYICFTSDCAARFGSRQRLSSISPLLTTIAQEYKADAEMSDKNLRNTLAAISVMSAMLATAVFFVGRQRNKLRQAGDNLAKSLRELAEANNELRASNDQLSYLNMQRKTLNSQLVEANKVKEEYVGRFMRLCSRYVDRLDDIRNVVKNKVNGGQWVELKAIMRTDDFKADYTDELYANFDEAFLHLYPDFVGQFNALLIPEARVAPPSKDRLNTQMRIFALIRLGITESGRISEILHCSVNTIYNYRAQAKKSSVCGKLDFEERVKAICS